MAKIPRRMSSTCRNVRDVAKQNDRAVHPGRILADGTGSLPFAASLRRDTELIRVRRPSESIPSRRGLRSVANRSRAFNWIQSLKAEAREITVHEAVRRHATTTSPPSMARDSCPAEFALRPFLKLPGDR